MEKLKNLFKKERKSSEKIEDVRENIKSMFETSDKELAKLSEEELNELSGGEEETDFPDEHEITESSDEETTVEGRISNFNTSLLNRIISDPVLRYALENGHLEFLRKVKTGKIMDEEYESMRKEMEENGGENFEFEGSLLQEISKHYVYYLALEKLDEKMLRGLLKHELTYNYYENFAYRNGEDNVMQIMGGGVVVMHYNQWIAEKGLK